MADPVPAEAVSAIGSSASAPPPYHGTGCGGARLGQPGLLQERGGGRAVAQLGDGQRRRLQRGERGEWLGGGDPLGDRVLVALAVGDDLLALGADQKGQKLLRR